jgi:nitrogen-specific signal transduction histidine kinase/CheY-like chemotaxis protein
MNGRDITEERQLEEQLHHAQKMEAIGRLAGGIAHDFNNILTAIQGYVALMREEVREGSSLASGLDEVRRGAERAARLTDQLLAFGRRQVVRPEVLDLNDVVHEMRSMLERLIGENVRLETLAGGRIGAVRADRGHLEQVLLNLVVNAKDAMDEGGRVEISTGNLDIDEPAAASLEQPVAPGRYVVLTVTDEGQGMDEATLSRIFEPFFTTKGQGKGTGLGLSTVYGSVRQAGGYVGVRSAPGCGASFSVYLPRIEAGADRRPGDSALETPPAPDGGIDGTGETILVVEDEAPVRRLMKKILERRGYRVLSAGDGEAAVKLAAAQDGPIDLLIADLVMPGIGGREVAERLEERRPGLLTVFVSGYTADEVVRRGIVHGQHAFLPKPFTPAALLQKVRDVLEARAPSSR